VIVSDAGPIIAFARANLLDLLGSVVIELGIPDAVHAELTVGGSARVEDVIQAEWIKRVSWVSFAKPNCWASSRGCGSLSIASVKPGSGSLRICTSSSVAQWARPSRSKRPDRGEGRGRLPTSFSTASPGLG
jgi:hypothetical protein